MLLVRYKDKKEIYFLSLIHGIKIERVPKRGREETAASKLSLVNDYNKFMGGVDRNDALIGNYSSVRKTLKRTVKVVFHFIEEAFLNAYILNEKFGVKKMRFLAFKLEIIESIITKNQLPELQIYEHPKLGRHYLKLIPPTEKKSYTSETLCCLFKAKQETRKSIPMQKLQLTPRSVSNAMFRKVSHLNTVLRSKYIGKDMPIMQTLC